MINKKNIPLIIALSIPILMIILVSVAIYLPGFGKTPQYNFVYVSYSNYFSYDQGEYLVSGGKLVFSPRPAKSFPEEIKPDNSVPHFYFYNVETKSASEISFADAQKYNLDSNITSPDGYVIERGNYGGGFIFGGGSNYNSWYIKGNNRATKLNLKLTGSDSYYDFKFLGWVK